MVIQIFIKRGQNLTFLVFDSLVLSTTSRGVLFFSVYLTAVYSDIEMHLYRWSYAVHVEIDHKMYWAHIFNVFYDINHDNMSRKKTFIILIDIISVFWLQNSKVKVKYIDIPSAQLSDII